MADLFNQPPPFEDVNLFTSDPALQDAVDRDGAGDAHLEAFGAVAGSRRMFEQAPGFMDANRICSGGLGVHASSLIGST